jgi:predicted nucleotidyltransferase
MQKAIARVKPDYTVVVMSSSFVQRGEPAIINKWQRARITIKHGVDAVIELPFVATVESADYFAHYSLLLLHEMGVTDLVFGSESGDVQNFIDIASAIENNQETYDAYVKEAMNQGLRYPDACNKALSLLLHKEVRTPNDLLGLSYVKEIVHHHYPITPHVIKRTNDYHETKLEAISSATALRKALLKGEDVSIYLPDFQDYQNDHFFSLNEFFEELKYAVLFHHDLSSLHLVEEGLDHRLLKTIPTVSNMTELVEAMSSKRYTKVRIQRMLCHILLNNTKVEIKEAMNIDYIRLLAFNDKGRELIKRRKDKTDFAILTSINQFQHPALEIEKKASRLLSLKDETIYKKEYRSIPYLKKS